MAQREVDLLHAKIDELQVQLQALRLKDGPRVQTKDISLVATIKEWTGGKKGKPVHEFLTQIETLAKVSGWSDLDKALIVKAKLQGLALQFLHGQEKLERDDCLYENLKQALVDRFSEKLPDQYYYTQLQEAVQGKDEKAEEFSDRCRKLCQKTIRKVQDEDSQRIINEEAERRLLAAYIHGLRGIVGQQVQYQMPSTMEQAVRVAVTVENAEYQRHAREGTRKVFTAKSDITCYKCARTGHYARECRRETGSLPTDKRSWNDSRNKWRDGLSHERQFTQAKTGRNLPCGLGYKQREPQCFRCNGFGHVRRDCPKLSQGSQPPNERGSAPRSPVSDQSSKQN
jgi:hypothetical protein